jgi:hypothetical protein
MIRLRAFAFIAVAGLASLLAGVTGATAEAADTEEREFDLVVGAMPASRPGERATVSLSILPRAGSRLLADGPLLVRLAGDRVTPERALLRREDAVDPRAEAPRFELPFRRPRSPASGAGATRAATLTATLTFYICRGARCRPVTEPVYIRDRTP